MSAASVSAPGLGSGAPRVSVVLPTLNRGALLERAVRSALGQTVRDLEVIVVDDGSTDDTPATLRRMVAADDRLRVVRSRVPGGAAAARNRGITLARGEWVGFLDDDDAWLPQKLERQLAVAASDTDAGLVYCPYLYDDGRGSLTVRNAWDPDRPPGYRKMLFRRLIVAVPTALVRRRLLVEVGLFDPDLPTLEEWDLFVRLAFRTRFAWTPEPLVVVHATEGSLSTRTDLYVTAVRRILGKFEAMEGVGREELAHVHYNAGHHLVARGARAAGLRSLLRAMRIHPWRWQRYPMILAALLGRRTQRWAIAVVLGLEARPWRKSRGASPPAEAASA
jgi:glycosyltransferase involved in cell wall biosynthesis